MTTSSTFQQHFAQTNGINMHVVETGTGPPVLFLHGFPEHWRAFAPMMLALATEFRCIAPDQRGYNLTDRPNGSQNYTIDILASDIAGLIEALDTGPVDIVAHDWGGLVAWHFAGQYPHLLKRLVVFNAPHPVCLQHALDNDPAQREASAYAAQFASPSAHLTLATQGPAALWTTFFGADAAKGWLTPADKDAILTAWAKEGAWEAMLNWYRAAGFDYTGSPAAPRTTPPLIDAPALLVWGGRDTLFAPSVLQGLTKIAPHCQVHIVPEGGHSLFREDRAACVALVRDFLAGAPKKAR
jgi:epoxide hydrolase 4